MKMMKVLVAVLVMAAMAVPVIAEDRLSLSGSLQVRGQIYSVDEEGGLDDDYAWNDMRMRIGGKIAVAEGVSVHFRFDTSESAENSSDPLAWGGDNQYSARRADIQFDKAYLQLEKNGFTLMAGELYHGLGSQTQAIADFTAPGFMLKYGGLTMLHATRFDENQGKDSFLLNKDGDSSFTAASYKIAGDGFTFTPMIGYNNDQSSADYDLLGIELGGSIDLGAVALKGAMNYFDGDYGMTATELKGLQFIVDGSMAASDAVKVGARVLYALGQDGANEMQVTKTAQDSVTDWSFVDFNPQHYGAYSSDFVYTDNFDIFDPSGMSAGVIAGQLYADVKASDSVDLKFAGLYGTVEDDTNADGDLYSLDAQIAYKVMANTSLVSHLNYMSVDDDVNNTTDDYLGIITGLTVKF